MFNKAAATVVVEEGGDGEVKVCSLPAPLHSLRNYPSPLTLPPQVDFNSSKDELSTKKIRRKAEKKMRASVKAKLYGNFVKYVLSLATSILLVSSLPLFFFFVNLFFASFP